MNLLRLPKATTPLCFLIAGLSLEVIYIRSVGLSFEWEAQQLLIRETGVLAFVLFCACFLCTPLRSLTHYLGYRGPSLVHWRRSLGLAATFVGALHMVVIYLLHVGDAPIFGAWFQPYAQAGAAAFLLLAILSITSFPKLTKRLKIRHWKTLHRLVFVIFFLLLLHVLLGPHLPSKLVIGALAVVAIVSSTGRLNP